MLRVEDLYCERQSRVLFEGLSFQVRPGELMQVKGGNGTGKTTLLKILTGLYEDYSGDVDWDLAAWPLFVGHKPGVKDQLTARENLGWLMKLGGQETGDETILDALSRVGLRGYEDTPCAHLSQGQRKRVNLARLYLSGHPAWVLDEPFSAIDVDGVGELQTRIENYLDSGGLVILTSHQTLAIRGNVRSLELGG